MKTEKAKALNNFVVNALDAFDIFINDIESKRIPDSNEMKKYVLARFEEKFQDFLDEFEDNVRKYRDKNLIRDYTVSCFTLPRTWKGFDRFVNQDVIRLGVETEFMLQLKISIEKYNNIMMCYFDLGVTDEVRSLNYNYDKLIEDIENNEIFKPQTVNIIQSSKTYLKEDRFDFLSVQKECLNLGSYAEKIKLINERLFDFEQWQVQSDNLITDRDIGQYYEYTVKYYNDFERLCNIELRRLETLMELDKRLPSSTDNMTESLESHLKWTASDTDLLELVAALYKNESIQRKDGKPLKRKELIDFFQAIFGLEIKDVENKLTRATARKTNMTPFLDKLKLAFENYAEQKDEKLRKRK